MIYCVHLIGYHIIARRIFNGINLPLGLAMVSQTVRPIGDESKKEGGIGGASRPSLFPPSLISSLPSLYFLFILFFASNNPAIGSAKVKVKKLKLNKALDENSSLSYGTSPAIWDHTVLPATRHKWTRPALTPASKLVLDLPTPEGWKAELT